MPVSPAALPTSPSPSLRILVADDDPTVQAMVEWVLREDGYTVSSASTMDEAESLLAAGYYAAVLTDTLGDSPDQVALNIGRLMAGAGGAPVLLMSGWRLDDETVRGWGCRAFVPKPFDIETLTAALAAALQRDKPAAVPAQAGGGS